MVAAGTLLGSDVWFLSDHTSVMKSASLGSVFFQRTPLGSTPIAGGIGPFRVTFLATIVIPWLGSNHRSMTMGAPGMTQALLSFALYTSHLWPAMVSEPVFSPNRVMNASASLPPPS